MKYLKKFKESKDEYYVGISLPIYNQYLDDLISIGTQNIDYIKKLFTLYGGPEKWTIKEEKVRNSSDSHLSVRIEPTKYNATIFIYEIPDEYFLVCIYGEFNTGNRRLSMYKCDQIDGVKELLIDLKIIYRV